MSKQEPPMSPPPSHLDIEIIEPDPEDCQDASLPPEGNVKLRNYRLLADNLRAYTPTGDIHTSPIKRKLVPRFEPCATLAPPRERILELVRPGDPGQEALEAIVRPAPRRGLQRPLDDDTRRFLQRALLSPSPLLAPTPEPPRERPPTPEPAKTHREATSCYNRSVIGERSLAEELREAEEGCGGGEGWYAAREFAQHGAAERDRLGRLALAVEGLEGAAIEGATIDGALGAAARRLDALLAESRALHAELAGIHDDMQVLLARQASAPAAAAPARR